MLLFMLMFFMEIRVMLLSFWLVPVEQLSRREGNINYSGKREREVSLHTTGGKQARLRLAGTRDQG